MIYQARKVLADCRLALDKLEHETDGDLWRIYWVASLVLVRAVGHVLHKVDGKQDERLGEVLRERFAEWKDPGFKEHIIFREFIERDRNMLLKEYEHNVYEDSSIPILVTTPEGAYSDALDENLYKPISTGPFEGEDARDILTDAIQWWEKELDCIEDKIG